MIKIGWKDSGMFIFDYTNETVVEFRINDEEILIIFDKKDNNDTKVTINNDNKYYTDFNNLFNNIFNKFKERNFVLNNDFCEIKLKEETNDYINLYHKSSDKPLCDQVSLCIQKQEKFIEYELFSFDKKEKQVKISKDDELGLFEIYSDFILKINKYPNYKYEKEMKDFELYINNRLSYYNIEIKNNYGLIDGYMHSLYYRELDENYSKEEIRKSLDLLKYLISENQRLNIERQELYDQMLNDEKKSSMLNSIEEADKIKKIQKGH